MADGSETKSIVHLPAEKGPGTRCDLPLSGGMAIFPDIATAERLGYRVCDACDAAVRAPTAPAASARPSGVAAVRPRSG
jgi:hypothetical protein